MYPTPNDLPDTFMLAASGGVDSMSLLDWLVRHERRPAVVVHVHHGLRADADDDGALVERICRTAKIPCRILNVTVRRANSVQQQARSARYGAIALLCFELGIPAVVTAHHLDDEMEASLAAQQDNRRGSPMQSTRKMSRWGIIIHRPLLSTSREQILRYATDHGVEWREDSSNHDLRYRRARLRAAVDDVVPDSAHRPKAAHVIDAQTSSLHRMRWLGVDLVEFMGKDFDSIPTAISEAFPGCDVSNAALKLIKQAAEGRICRRIDSHGICVWVEDTIVIHRTLGSALPIDQNGGLRWAGQSGPVGHWLSGTLARNRGGQGLREWFRVTKTPAWYRQIGPVCWQDESPDARPHLLQPRSFDGLRLTQADALEF